MRSAALEAVLSDFSTLVTPASRLERPAAPTVPSGITAVDELTGGLPRGCLTEICGPASSGRTTLMLAAFAEATTRGEVCALIDASDCFDPVSAQQAGVDLERVLWVRCSEHSASGSRQSEKTNHGFARTGTDRNQGTVGRGSTRIDADQKRLAFGIQHSAKQGGGGGTSLNKDKETRFINSGMKSCGSRGVHTQIYSGMPEIPEINVLTRPEQRYRDINKLKQGDYSEPGRAEQATFSISQHTEPGVGKIPPKSEHSAFGSQHSVEANRGFSRIGTDEADDEFRRGSTRMDADFKSEIGNQKSEIESLLAMWNMEPGRRLSPATRAELARVEQALKVADLLLQSGGFGLIALDLGNISVRSARRVPLTSWFRFRRAVENTATVLLVLEREAHARSCASLVLQLSMSSSVRSAKRPPRRHTDADAKSAVSIQHSAKPNHGFSLISLDEAEDEFRRGSTQMDADWKSEMKNQKSKIEPPSHAELLTGIDSCAEIARGERKGAGSVRAEFASQSAWSA